MLAMKLVAAAVVVTLAGAGLAGCATAPTDGSRAATIAAWHQHPRDAKGGAPLSTTGLQHRQTARNPLHDHREWK